MTGRPLDAVVVGSGPNGLAAALVLARAGLSVEVVEGAATAGGGCRTEELTEPGFHHDVCAAVHPLAAASPFFATLDLAGLGVRLRTPDVSFAHPLDGGRAGAVRRSVTETAGALGADEGTYRRLLGPLDRDADLVVPALLAPLRRPPRHPVALARFGRPGLGSAVRLAGRFETAEARALLAGVGAHSMLPLDAPLSGAFSLLLTTLAHAAGWPVVEGGSAALVRALLGALERAGAPVRTGRWVRSLDELPPARATLLDVTPRQFLDLAAGRLGSRERRALARYRYGPGVCKVDWALAGPVPWEAAVCRETVTVHVGGSLAEVAASEAAANAGRHAERPFCLVVQPGVLDPTRAPAGHQTLWAYCHVPNGSTVDMTGPIEAQIERFAPGFRDLVIARSTRTAAEIEAHNPGYVGGDIGAGAATVGQTLFRPTVRWDPYRTGLDGVYLCSAATPPGAGVHGMCGVGAARSALRHLGVRPPR